MNVMPAPLTQCCLAISSVEEFDIHFHPVGSWIVFIGIVIFMAGVLFFLGPDRTRVSQKRLFALVVMRLGAFLSLLLCLLRPTFIAVTKTEQETTLVLLADASQSMSVADGPNGQTRWEQLVASLDTVATDFERLEDDHGVAVSAWQFNRQANEMGAYVPKKTFPEELSQGPESDETAIGAALDDVVRTMAGQTLAGVIVLSDGAQHAYPPRDIPPQTAARKVGRLGVPLWSIVFGEQRGGSQGRDASIINLSVSDTVYIKNSLEIAGRVRLDGLTDRDAIVRLLAENEAGEMKEVSQTTVRGTSDSLEVPVRLSWTPATVGERKLSLLVDAQEGEVVTSNNELSTFVDVVDGGLRVLYLEGALRVEQRFLRRVLSATPGIQVDFRWIDSTTQGRRAWPVDLSRDLQSTFDVVLIGDLDSSALSQKDIEMIRLQVGQGMGLGMLGGFHAFEAGGWGSTSLKDALPFEADRLARQQFDEPIRESLHINGPIQMLPDERFGGISILKLADTKAKSSEVWNRVPPLAGANDLGKLVPTAKTLARTEDGRSILVGREYGEGRVLAFAADSTWQWVMQGAQEAHRQFWRQMVLWLARRDGDQEDKLWLRLARRRMPPSSVLEFDTGLAQVDDKPAKEVTFDCQVTSPSGVTKPIRVGLQGETYSGIVTDISEIGDWKLEVVATTSDGVKSTQTSRFTVFRQDVELANPRANPLLMRQLAEATQGGVRTAEEITDIVDEIRNRPATFETLEEWSYTPWDKWPLFLVLTAFLCGEWFLRKRFGLV
ncbi:MAG: hypothetical protein ABGW78_14375 [Pirellulales bacterium]